MFALQGYLEGKHSPTSAKYDLTPQPTPALCGILNPPHPRWALHKHIIRSYFVCWEHVWFWSVAILGNWQEKSLM